MLPIFGISNYEYSIKCLCLLLQVISINQTQINCDKIMLELSYLFK